MVGALIAFGVVFYGVLYSGIRSLQGRPISTIDALRGREPKTTGTGSRPPAGMGVRK